jgi:conjugative relaxase-like TrwC/TraI family protein
VLSVGKVGPANAGYYQSAVVQGAEDYYAGDGDAPGRWVGRADLVGAVAGEVATAVEAGLLLEAKAAPDGSRLGKTTVTDRSVTAFDLTFSAPKSVSVLYALSDTRVVAAVEAAHTNAVLQSVASLSPRIAYTRTGHAGVAVVDAEGVFGIRYRHRTSRAMDPQLHDHVLISNAVRTVSDGEWRTLDARGLYRQAKAAGVEYQTYLRAGLRASLGVEFGEVDANGQADIVGIDDTVLAEFSTRSVDIETELENWVAGFVEREGRKPSAVEVGRAHKTVTLATRTAKPADAALTTATLRERWRERADGIVDVEHMLTTVFGDPSPPAVIRPTVEEVLEAVETKHAQWAEAQLLEEIAARITGPDPATIAEVIEAVRAEAMGSFGVVDLTPPAEDGDRLRASDGRPVHVPPSAGPLHDPPPPSTRSRDRRMGHRTRHREAPCRGGRRRTPRWSRRRPGRRRDGDAVRAAAGDHGGRTSRCRQDHHARRRRHSLAARRHQRVRGRTVSDRRTATPRRCRDRCGHVAQTCLRTQRQADRRTRTRRRVVGSPSRVGGHHRRKRNGRHQALPRLLPDRASEAVAHGAGW